jgi:geranylgeranyl diphosphate synthase type II
MPDVEALLRAQAARFEAALPAFLPAGEDPVSQAARYSANGGGKRIRPVLVLAFCALFGGDAQTALPLAAALEMIHAYSLIHDDLPCIDNDDYRRGRLSCHRKFGEATALLAGDALLTQAFWCAAQGVVPAEAGDGVLVLPSLAAKTRCEAIALLANAAGAGGMIAGQQLDLAYEKKQGAITRAQLEDMNRKKTGALLGAACALGCLCAGAGANATAAALRYADYVGLLFQLTDDILDVEGTREATGKSQGKDQAAGKSTWVSLLGLRRAKMLAKEFGALAQEEIKDFAGVDSLVFCLPRWLATRGY